MALVSLEGKQRFESKVGAPLLERVNEGGTGICANACEATTFSRPIPCLVRPAIGERIHQSNCKV